MARRAKSLNLLPPSLPLPTQSDILIREAVDCVEEEDVEDPEEDEAGERSGESQMGGCYCVAPEDCELQREIAREEPEGEGEEPHHDLGLQQEGGEDADISQGGLTAGWDVPQEVPDKLMRKVNDSLHGDGEDDPGQYLTGRVWVVGQVGTGGDVRPPHLHTRLGLFLSLNSTLNS